MDKTVQIDHIMHLNDLTGFYCTPGHKGRDDQVSYIQAYSTEKMSYQLHHGLFAKVEPRALLSKTNLKYLLNKAEIMSAVLFECTADGQEHNFAQEGTVWVEIRIQLSEALTSFTRNPGGILDNCLVEIPAKFMVTMIPFLFFKIMSHLCISTGTSSGINLLLFKWS